MSVPFDSSWLVNANGWVGGQLAPGTNPCNLNLQFLTGPNTIDDTFTFTGTLRFGAQTTNVNGSYDGAAKRIQFTRDIGGGKTQTYTGYLGDHVPSVLIIAGTFTESDISSSAVRHTFGWFAEQWFGWPVLKGTT